MQNDNKNEIHRSDVLAKMPLHRHEKAFVQRCLFQYIVDHSLTLNKTATAISAFTDTTVSSTLLNGFLNNVNDTNTLTIRNIRRFLMDVYPDLGIEKFRLTSDPTRTVALTVQACFEGYAKFKDTASVDSSKIFMEPISELDGVNELSLVHQAGHIYKCELYITLSMRDGKPRTRPSRLIGSIPRCDHRFHGYLVDDSDSKCVFFIHMEEDESVWIITLRQAIGDSGFTQAEFSCRLTLEEPR